MRAMLRDSNVMTVACQRLSSSLPSLMQLSGAKDADEQARVVLHLVLDRIPFNEELEETEPVNSDPMTCPNCGHEAASTLSPYCCEACREEAAFVRQFRSGLASGSALDPIRQAALGQSLWHVLGGGYPRRKDLVPQRTVEKVIQRDLCCTVCGQPATTIDHTGSG